MEVKGYPGILYIDSFEPQSIITGLVPIMPTVVAPINTYGKADYYWVDPQGNERMIERKQISEALSDIDAVEEQLGRHLHECDELTLLVEGVALGTPKGVQIYNYSAPGWHKGYEHTRQPTLWSRWHSFKYALWHSSGVYVEEVAYWTDTIEHIATAYKKSMDPSNTTLRRYVVPHIPPFDKNPHIDNLCRLQGMGLGEKTASQLIKELHTIHGVITAPYTTLVGIMGGPWTKKFLEAIGRED